MNEKQTQLIETLYRELPSSVLPYYIELVNALVELGYKPYKRAAADFALDFKHKQTKKPLAQIGYINNAAKFRMKYSSCTDVPERFIAALHRDDASRRTLNGKTPHHDMKNHELKLFCGHCGDRCTSGGWAYMLKTEDGEKLPRCGAYPPEIPIINEQDVTDVKRLMLEQHKYLMDKWV